MQNRQTAAYSFAKEEATPETFLVVTIDGPAVKPRPVETVESRAGESGTEQKLGTLEIEYCNGPHTHDNLTEAGRQVACLVTEVILL